VSAWTNSLVFAVDQVVTQTRLGTLIDNLRYLRETFGVRHNLTTGDHNDPLVARAFGSIKYNGTRGSGGAWQSEAGAGFSVGNQTPDNNGRGLVTFSSTMANANYAVLMSPRASDNVANATDSPTDDVWIVRMYNATTTTFDFVVSNCPVESMTFNLSSNGLKFSMAALGTI
jgi:hypothetical protein